MAYFLKKTNLKRGVYLQIYESFYNRDKRRPPINHTRPLAMCRT